MKRQRKEHRAGFRATVALETLRGERTLNELAGQFEWHQRPVLEQAGQTGFRGTAVELAILFADIRGFTSLAGQMSPEELIRHLNDYLGQMTYCTDVFGGYVDKFIGDAVMALFSLPQPTADDAEQAAPSSSPKSDRLP